MTCALYNLVSSNTLWAQNLATGVPVARRNHLCAMFADRRVVPGKAFRRAGSASETTLLGHVTAQGRPVDSATVTISNPVSGSVLTTFTDNDGAWSMPGVRRGLYLVRVEKNGYSPFARQLSVLSVHQELDVSLPPLAEDAPRGIGG
jgi:hypothetical protein